MVVLYQNNSLGQGISGAGSALGQALGTLGTRKFEKEQKQSELLRQRNLEEEKRLKVQEGGTILQSLLGQLGPNASIQDVQGVMAQAIQAGVDPSLVQNFAQQYAPQIKEQARTQGAQSFLQQLFGGGAPQGGIAQQGAPQQGGIAQQGAPQFGGQEIGFEEPRGPQTSGFNISQVPEESLVAASAAPYPEIASLAKTELQRRDLAQKRGEGERKFEQSKFESERKYQSELSTPFLKKVDESRDAVRQKEGALDLMTNAIEEGNLGFFSKDNFANFLGRFGEGLRTTKGAQLINAQKEFLLSNISRAGARPNQWIEQQIANMLAKTGRSEEANLTVTEALRAETELERKKIQVTDELADQYRKEVGYVPSNIGAMVDKQLKPYAEEVQNRLAYRLREFYETEQGVSKLAKSTNKKVNRGTPLTLVMAREFVKKYKTVDKALENARKLGYTIPSKDEWKRWQR